MLDFYVTTQGSTKKNLPDEKDRVGGLSLSEHSALNPIWWELKKQGIEISFFEDTRLSAEVVSQMKGLLDNSALSQKMKAKANQKALAKLKAIVEAAASRSSGLKTYCD